VFFLNTNANPKEGFIEGYIINLNKDTIFGYVKDRKPGTFNKLYKKIIFKSKKGRKKKYDPNEILGYKRGEDEFVSLWFMEKYFFLDSWAVSKEDNGEKLFFKHIMKGYLDYFHLEYVEENGIIDHRTYFKRKNEDKMVFVRTGIFGLNKKKLASYFSDCPALQDGIMNKTFTQPFEIVSYYNNWFINEKLRIVKSVE
jgi:hypothetical protein